MAEPVGDGTDSEVSEADWRGQELTAMKHHGVAFLDVDLTEVVNTDAAFLNCSFNQCNFFDASFTDSKFVGSKFERCKFAQLKVHGGDWSFVSLAGADLRTARLTDCRLREADLTAVWADRARS